MANSKRNNRFFNKDDIDNKNSKSTSNKSFTDDASIFCATNDINLNSNNQLDNKDYQNDKEIGSQNQKIIPVQKNIEKSSISLDIKALETSNNDKIIENNQNKQNDRNAGSYSSVLNNDEVIFKDGINNSNFGAKNSIEESDEEVIPYRTVKPKKKYKKSFKQRMRTIGILTMLGIFTGSGLGVWYFNNAIGPSIDYSQYNEEDYIVTAQSVLQDVYDINSNYENWLDIAKTTTGKSSPADLTPAQNFILAEYNASLVDTFHIVGNGEVSASVFGITTTQSVYSEKNYDGSYYTFESISTGMLPVGKCSVMERGKNGVRLYSSTNVTSDSAVWKDYQDYSSSEYVTLAGSTPDGIQSYIISDKTITSTNDNSVITYDQDTGYYSFTVELDPITSVLRYVRQVKQTSGLSSLPSFSAVSQTITIDENWNLISISIEESYSVIYGVSASCKGSLTSYYYFNDPSLIDFPVDPSLIDFDSIV